MNHGWRWGKGVLQQGDSKSPRVLQGRKVHTQAGRSQHSHRAARDKQDSGPAGLHPTPAPCPNCLRPQLSQ